MIKALTYEEILTTMKTKFKQESGFEADDASDIGIRLRLLAGQLFSQSADISFVANQVFLQTASGEFLDKHAQMRGFSRRLATKAHGTARFATAKAALSDIVIPIGTLCAISGANAQNYATTQQATLLQGKTFVDIPIVAQSSGTNGNAALGCVTILINPPQGINSVTNTTVITGGSEQEDDELLRSRIFKSFAQISNGANQQFYEEIAMQNPKVISVNAISTARGAGTVDVVFDTAEQDTAQINAIKNALDTQLASSREIGTDAKAFCCTNQAINITVYLKTKADFVSSEVISKCKQKITEYVDSLRVGENLIISRLANILFNIEGIENYKLATPTDDTAISGRSKLKIGTLTVADVI